MSIIRKIGKEKLTKIINQSPSFSESLRRIGITPKGGNLNTLKKVLNEFEIDYSHIPLGRKSNIGRKFPSPPNKMDLCDILVENSTYTNNARLRQRLIKENILENKCYICGLEPFWNNQSLTLTLDHIDGIGSNNLEENLRILCPNCHSQTDTFAGKNLRKDSKNSRFKMSKKKENKNE